MRCGKLAPKPDSRAPKLARLAGGVLPPAPAFTDWAASLTASPLFCNDALGCCTIAAAANRLRVLTSSVWGDEFVLPDAAVRETYFGLTGGGDDGLFETDVLNALACKGIALPGRQTEDVLTGWVTLNHRDPNELRLGIAWFGGIMGGFALPANAEALFDAGLAWDVPAGQKLTGEWLRGAGGGHEIYGAAYTPAGIEFITWGRKILVTNAFMSAYMDEAEAALSRLWLDATGAAPAGLDLPHLESCMAQIRAAPMR